MAKDILIFRPQANKNGNSKVMRVSDSFEELVTYIKIKTNLPIHEITHLMAAYLVDKIVIDDGEGNGALFRKE